MRRDIKELRLPVLVDLEDTEDSVLAAVFGGDRRRG